MREAPIDTFKTYLRKVFARESSLGVILLIMVVIAMAWANSPWEASYHQLWKLKVSIGIDNFKIDKSLHHWINDGLMAYFFFLIGLEVKRELIGGELSKPKKAALPLFAAIGGMVVPALVYYLINYGGPGANGWGIAMATDIAFSIGLLALAGRSVSRSSRTYLTALATVDDIGAILVIAFLLTTDIEIYGLLAGAVYFLLMMGGNLLGIRSGWFYFIFGVFGLWVALLLSGIHATLAGVLAAFTIPARTKLLESEFSERMQHRRQQFRETEYTDDPLLSQEQVQIIQAGILDSKRALTPLQRVENNIKPFVHYLVLPVFALSNAGVSIRGHFFEMLLQPISLGIIAGLVLGKLIGIYFASRLAVSSSLGQLPAATRWRDIAGLAMMAGIGFTMSIFIAELALKEELLLQYAKVGILVGSSLSCVLGLAWLRYNDNH